ncbi:Adenosylmethionine-8-amino-7-oxononanoate aminotransferase [compost metagenome]
MAIKVALQYFFNKNQKRTTIIAFENAFHGDTFAAMAASGISFYTQAFQGMFIDVVRIPVPVKGQEQVSFDALKNVIQTHNCAGFIFEPLVQGAAGMVMHEPEALAKLIQICKENKVLTIADEVMTGFGKTGKTFAMNYVAENPDMICLSKALTGGTIPMAITTFTQEVFDAFYDDDINKALFHGHTFTANPTGCAAALASIDLLQTDEMQANIKRINKSHLAFQQKIENHSKVITARTLGVIFAVEIKSDAEESYYGSMRTKLYNFFIDKGVILRPVGNIVYILPPYIMTDEQLQKVYKTIEEAIEMV